MKTIFKTNKPHSIGSHNLIANIPDGITVDVQISADGVFYETIGDPITGAQILQINDMVCGTFLKFVSASDADIAVIF